MNENKTQKEVYLKLRISKLEKEYIMQKVKKLNLSFSEFARQMLLNGEVIVLSPEEKKILGGLSNNVNQLTKKFHQKGYRPSGLLLELSTLLNHIRNAYRRSS